MTRSLRQRLSLWLSVAIIVMSTATAGITFWMSFRDANALQDTLLQQIAAALSSQPVMAPRAHFQPRSGEDAETHLVIRPLGSAGVDPNPRIDVMLPASLAPGLQDIEAFKVHWRVFVRDDSDGHAFGVARRQRVRDETARDSALTALGPMLVLAPLPMLIVNGLLLQGFAPLVALSGEVDAGDVRQLKALSDADIPSEVLPIVHAINRLLARVSGLLEQQRRLVADAAHAHRRGAGAVGQPRKRRPVLRCARTPGIASARARAQLRTRRPVAQAGARAGNRATPCTADGARYPDPHRHRGDAGTGRVTPGRSGRHPAGSRDSARRLDARVRALIRNAIDNAVRYTPPGGWVDVSLVVDEGDALLSPEARLTRAQPASLQLPAVDRGRLDGRARSLRQEMP